MTDVVLVLTTVPTPEQGEAMGRILVDECLAACVNVLPPMTSVYRWHGAVEQATECQLVMKTARDRVAALRARLSELHGYELPELLIVAVEDAGERYGDWVRASTRPPR